MEELLKVIYLRYFCFSIVGFLFGVLLCEFQKMDPDIYLANTIGSQISQVNDIYSKFDEDAEFLDERFVYNRDMLTIVDCSYFLKGLALKRNSQNLTYFREGVARAWKELLLQGSKKENLNLCDGWVLEWLE